MLEIDQLKVAYTSNHQRVNALGPMTINLEKGEIYAIIGPSGCGKSTLLHVLGGIIHDFDGQVQLNGERLEANKCTIGFIPQNFGLLPWKNVEKNCRLSLKIKGVAMDQQVKERVDSIMHRLDIHTLKHRYPNELSGGQRQRVAIARAFIMNPDLLLMDEPFSALDSLTREEAGELFIDVWNQYKVTTVFVTHSIEEAIFIGKKIIIMSHCPGTIVEVIDNPLFNRMEEVRNLLGGGTSYLELSSYIRGIVKRGWKR
ncbi:MAG: nitrate/sulfonate/bicarbonate ABC transporter ATP-binding protein [Firmicutes bacterium HGW-Firmicutes-1]|jgi:NitT/TauT family transport system ATP-binding protein|nr:MAG: nitrate/sulfonate/bicarbonate ABC transporter ATP-binding protein [Firmicutes bacterium HGW-Firmicutes-1]